MSDAVTGIAQAWRECQDAMPSGWELYGVFVSGHGPGIRWTAYAQGPKRSTELYANQNNATPVAALRDLTRIVRERFA